MIQEGTNKTIKRNCIENGRGYQSQTRDKNERWVKTKKMKEMGRHKNVLFEYRIGKKI